MRWGWTSDLSEAEIEVSSYSACHYYCFCDCAGKKDGRVKVNRGRRDENKMRGGGLLILMVQRRVHL